MLLSYRKNQETLDFVPDGCEEQLSHRNDRQHRCLQILCIMPRYEESDQLYEAPQDTPFEESHFHCFSSNF